MDKQEACCDSLIEVMAAALNEDAIALMLVTVQKDNLGFCVKLALKQSVLQFRRTLSGNLTKQFRVYAGGGFNNADAISIVKWCRYPFPYLWVSVHLTFIVVHDHNGQYRTSW